MEKKISDSLYSTRVSCVQDLRNKRDARATPVVLHLIKLFEYRSLSCYKQRIWGWCFLFQPDRIKVPSYFGASKKNQLVSFFHGGCLVWKNPRLTHFALGFRYTSSFFWTTTCYAFKILWCKFSLKIIHLIYIS